MTLLRAQHGKCCYCERKIDLRAGDVEHWRPKAAVQQAEDQPLESPGYYLPSPLPAASSIEGGDHSPEVDDSSALVARRTAASGRRTSQAARSTVGVGR